MEALRTRQLLGALLAGSLLLHPASWIQAAGAPPPFLVKRIPAEDRLLLAQATRPRTPAPPPPPKAKIDLDRLEPWQRKTLLVSILAGGVGSFLWIYNENHNVAAGLGGAVVGMGAGYVGGVLLIGIASGLYFLATGKRLHPLSGRYRFSWPGGAALARG